MKYQKSQEAQATCPHVKLNKEMEYDGNWTGHMVCPVCKKTFAPEEKILPVEYRNQMIITPHALRIALKTNPDLMLNNNSDPRVREFEWFLVSKSTGECRIGVARKAVEDCIKEGIFQKKEN